MKPLLTFALLLAGCAGGLPITAKPPLPPAPSGPFGGGTGLCVPGRCVTGPVHLGRKWGR